MKFAKSFEESVKLLRGKLWQEDSGCRRPRRLSFVRSSWLSPKAAAAGCEAEARLPGGVPPGARMVGRRSDTADEPHRPV